MKKRKSIVVLSALVIIFALVSIGLILGGFAASSSFSDALNGLLNHLKGLFSGSADTAALAVALSVWGVSVIVLLVWIIVDAKRKNKSIILFALCTLIVGFLSGLVASNSLGLFKALLDGSLSGTSNVLAFSGACALCVSEILLVVLFICDLATGSKCVAKEASEEAIAVEEAAVEEPVEEAKAEEPVAEEPAVEEPAEEKVEEPVVEDRPLVVSKTEIVEPKESAPKKVSAKKDVSTKEEPKKESMKKEEKKPAAKKAAAKKPAAKPAAKKEAAKKPEGKKVYHVSKRAEDGLWVIKFAGGEKVIKTFKTKVEAVEYADELAKNQGGVALTHASKGKNAGKINGKI